MTKIHSTEQQSLKDSLDYNRAIFDATPDAMLINDEHGIITMSNQQAERLLGYSANELLGLSIEALVSERSRAKHPELRAQFAASGISRLMGTGQGVKVLCKNETELDVEISISPIKTAQGLFFASALRDITERIKAQRALQDKDRMLSEAQRIAQLGSWVLDIVSGELIWSDEVYRVFEVEPSQFGASYEAFLDRIHPDDRDAVNQAYSNSLVTQMPYEIIHRLQMKDGSIKWVHEKCATDFNEKGEPISSRGMVQDITEYRQKEDALNKAKLEAEKANQAKIDFLASMSHELFTPMNSVLGFAQILECEDLTEEQHGLVDAILAGGYKLLDLIKEVLDFSIIESGELELTLGNLDLAALVQNCITLMQPLAVKNSIKIINNLTTACRITVVADSLRLKQVLLNLISNALKYNRVDGSIILTCELITPHTLRISVTDTGTGLSEEQLAKLFHPFERLSAKNSAIEGAGLGLSLSKKLIEAMNGSVGVNSTPGEGSCFWIEIPCLETVAYPEIS